NIAHIPFLNLTFNAPWPYSILSDHMIQNTRIALGLRSCSEPFRAPFVRSEEHTSELQSPYDLVCRLLLEKKKKHLYIIYILSPHHTICPPLQYFFFFILPLPPRSTLFPYTTLFRSNIAHIPFLNLTFNAPWPYSILSDHMIQNTRIALGLRSCSEPFRAPFV